MAFNTAPLKAAEIVSKLPKVGTPQMKAQVEMLKKIYKKSDDTLGIFTFFINGDWRYQNINIYKVIEKMSPEEQQEFNCDCKCVDWPSYTRNFAKGIAIWVLKEDQIEPIHGLE